MPARSRGHNDRTTFDWIDVPIALVVACCGEEGADHLGWLEERAARRSADSWQLHEVTRPHSHHGNGMSLTNPVVSVVRRDLPLTCTSLRPSLIAQVPSPPGAHNEAHHGAPCAQSPGSGRTTMESQTRVSRGLPIARVVRSVLRAAHLEAGRACSMELLCGHADLRPHKR
jgi:hypothetical protein